MNKHVKTTLISSSHFQKIIPIFFVIFCFFNVITKAEDSPPCVEFSIKKFPDTSETVLSIIENIQVSNSQKLPDNKSDWNVSWCEDEIRDYTSEQITVLSLLGTLHYENSQFEDAATLFEEVLLFGREDENIKEICTAHKILGHISDLQQYKLTAYFHLQKLLELGEKYEDDFSLISAYLQLGAFSAENGVYLDAEREYKRALDLCGEGDKTIQNWIYHRLGDLKRVQGENDEAIKYLKMAISFWEETKQTKGLSFSNLLLGVIYHSMADMDKSLLYLNRSLEAGLKSDYKLCRFEAMMNLGYHYFNQKAYEESLSFFQGVLDLKMKNKPVLRELEARKMLARIYTAKGEDRKANENYTIYQNGYDEYASDYTLNKVESIKKVEKLIVQKKEYELLQQEKIYDTERMYFQNIILIFSFLALVLMIALAYNYYSKNKKNRLQKETLQILNNKIKKQTLELKNAKNKIEIRKKDLEVEMVKKAMILSQQGEVLKSISDRLDDMKLNENTIALKKEMTKTKNDSLWTELNVQITQANEVLFEKLLRKYPSLTQTDLRLCAFLKLNMSTKEIANLTFKNPESVKVARSRLRKKLGLTHTSIRISNFLNTIE